MKMMKQKLLSLLAIGCAGSAHAAITYVDATSGVSGNTTLAAGGTFSPPLNGTTGLDNNWEERTSFGNSTNIFEASGEQLENAPRLLVTVPLANGTYDMYAYFWSPANGDANQQWLLRAGLVDEAGDLPLYSRPIAGITTPVNPSGMLIASQVTSTAGFTTAPVIVDGGSRYLFQASLGQIVVTDGTAEVFIDDYANPATVNNRTWFDGVGYEAVPEPSAALLGAFGLLGLLRRRR